MKYKDLVKKLNDHLQKNPELGELHVYHWSEHDENYIGFDDTFKNSKKGFIEKGQTGTCRLGEEEVFYTVKEYNDTFDEKFKKDDLEQIILL